MKVVILVILLTSLIGCTLKFEGEWSIMKQWDRPVEAIVISKEAPK